MLTLLLSKQFKKDLKHLRKSGSFDESLLRKLVDKLISGQSLDPKLKDHALTGEMNNYRECHLKPDLLLIYIIFKDEVVLQLMRIGSHSELFRK